jgi:hypothetical protein
MKKSPVDFSIARKGGEFVFLRYAIKTFTECLSVLRYAIETFTECLFVLRFAIETFTECLFVLRFAIETATGSFFIFQEKKETQREKPIFYRGTFYRTPKVFFLRIANILSLHHQV